MRIKSTLIILSALFCFLIADLSFAAPDYAVDGLYQHGFYVGALLGYVDPNNNTIHYFNDDSIFIPSISSKIGGRFFAGYAYNDFYAAELGYNRLIHASSGDSHTYLSGFDLLAKATLPINIYFSAFAKGGFAYIDQDFRNMSGSTTVYRKDNQRLLLTVAGGGEFHVTSRLALQALITHMFGRGGIDNITVYGIGAQYTF